MPPTLGTLLRTPRLRLSLLTGGEQLDRQVRWVAVSELTDPTPYLEGGELVLTTGVRWHDDLGAARDYVRRLVGREVAGLGFGSGVTHPEVPADLVEAATELGLPLIEVPRPTPFIAIGKEVSRLLAREQYEGLTRAFAAQRQLTQAALRGADAVVDRLGAELGGWVLLLAPDGALRHAFPAGAAHRAVELGREVHRLRDSRYRAGASVSAVGESVALQPLGVGGRIRGFLAVGGERGLGPDERTLVNAAISLLSLELARTEPVRGEGIQGGVLAALLDGAIAARGPGADRLRAALPAEPVAVALADAGAETAPLWDPALDGCLVAELDGRLTVLGAAGERPGEILSGVVEGPVGESEPCGYDSLPTARTQAERALEAARREGGGVVRHGDLPGGLLGLLDTPSGERIAGDLLAPLLAHRSAGDLVGSLRAYLAASGRWDAAADALGVHRHTLRYRITRIRELLPGDLDDPDYRAELWFALRMLTDG
ncbi:PucR family transcriptional regulator [Marinactinospora thermotolerans]|uniref:Purine catabolism regulatory protein n=1 Tax=Marinactinospora thermotolerans DSM 45154 TaxID=1122192 RepID=A0A1T4SGQ3_9ACTN|nr:PucR family transcriptional regulator [Marinactinospora thermotolerans]SKA27377.1 purine catabolism regulatory protein [Marinactinospora thermotolerans DSM 45154]